MEMDGTPPPSPAEGAGPGLSHDTETRSETVRARTPPEKPGTVLHST